MGDEDPFGLEGLDLDELDDYGKDQAGSGGTGEVDDGLGCGDGQQVDGMASVAAQGWEMAVEWGCSGGGAAQPAPDGSGDGSGSASGVTQPAALRESQLEVLFDEDEQQQEIEEQHQHQHQGAAKPWESPSGMASGWGLWEEHGTYIGGPAAAPWPARQQHQPGGPQQQRLAAGAQVTAAGPATAPRPAWQEAVPGFGAPAAAAAGEVQLVWEEEQEEEESWTDLQPDGRSSSWSCRDPDAGWDPAEEGEGGAAGALLLAVDAQPGACERPLTAAGGGLAAARLQPAVPAAARAILEVPSVEEGWQVEQDQQPPPPPPFKPLEPAGDPWGAALEGCDICMEDDAECAGGAAAQQQPQRVQQARQQRQPGGMAGLGAGGSWFSMRAPEGQHARAPGAGACSSDAWGQGFEGCDILLEDVEEGEEGGGPAEQLGYHEGAGAAEQPGAVEGGGRAGEAQASLTAMASRAAAGVAAAISLHQQEQPQQLACGSADGDASAILAWGQAGTGDGSWSLGAAEGPAVQIEVGEGAAVQGEEAEGAAAQKEAEVQVLPCCDIVYGSDSGAEGAGAESQVWQEDEVLMSSGKPRAARPPPMTHEQGVAASGGAGSSAEAQQVRPWGENGYGRQGIGTLCRKSIPMRRRNARAVTGAASGRGACCGVAHAVAAAPACSILQQPTILPCCTPANPLFCRTGHATWCLRMWRRNLPTSRQRTQRSARAQDHHSCRARAAAGRRCWLASGGWSRLRRRSSR